MGIIGFQVTAFLPSSQGLDSEWANELLSRCDGKFHNFVDEEFSGRIPFCNVLTVNVKL